MLKKIFWILGLFCLGVFMVAIWFQNYYFVSEFPQEGLILEVWNKPPARQVKARKLWKETLLRFEQEFPDIKIRGLERKFSPQEFITAMAGGKGPDVMHIWIGALPILARKGFIAPLDEYITEWDQKDYIPERVWEPARVNGKTYGIPRDTYFTVLFYRKDLFYRAGLNPERPPRDWEELVRYAKILTLPEKGQYGFGWPSNTWNFMDFVWQNGGELVARNPRGGWRATLDTAPVVETLKFLRDLKLKHQVLPPSDLTSHEDVSQMFALGRVAMMMGVANQLPTLINKYGLNFKAAGIAPLPAGPAGLRASHAGGEVYIINSAISPERRAAAWKYIEFEISPANQLWKWVRMKELKMMVFPGAFSASTNLLNVPGFAMVNEELQFVRNEPHMEQWILVKDALDNGPLQAIFVDKDLNLENYMRDFNYKINRDYFSKP